MSPVSSGTSHLVKWECLFPALQSTRLEVLSSHTHDVRLCKEMNREKAYGLRGAGWFATRPPVDCRLPAGSRNRTGGTPAFH